MEIESGLTRGPLRSRSGVGGVAAALALPFGVSRLESAIARRGGLPTGVSALIVARRPPAGAAG